MKKEKLREYELEKSSLNQNVEDLKSSLVKLNNEVKKHKEKELLLLQYPDLYGPLPQKETDLLTDMESQILANKYRIDLLETQNSKLKVTIQQLANSINSQPQPANVDTQPNKSSNGTVVGRPVPLFKLENEIQDEVKAKSETAYWNQNLAVVEPAFYQQEDYVSTENIYVHTSPDTGHNSYSVKQHANLDNQSYGNYSRRSSYGHSINDYRSNSYRGQRKNSGRNVTPVTPPPVSNMEVVIGRGHRPNSATRPQSGITKRPPSANSNKQTKKESPDIHDKYYCERCYKNYSNKRDLDIHKLYCNK